MKPILKFTACILLIIISISSCEKEPVSQQVVINPPPPPPPPPSSPPTGVDTIYRTGNYTVYEFYKVPQGTVFEELDMYMRQSTVSLPAGVNVSHNNVQVFVIWNNTMGWAEVTVCGNSCTIVDRFSTVRNGIVNVYLRADPFYPTGNAADTIAVKLIIR